MLVVPRLCYDLVVHWGLLNIRAPFNSAGHTPPVSRSSLTSCVLLENVLHAERYNQLLDHLQFLPPKPSAAACNARAAEQLHIATEPSPSCRPA